MNAKEFFENQSITDANRSIIDKNKHKFNRFDVVNFAESYYQYKTKQNNKPIEYLYNNFEPDINS
jgi:DNA-directed RNA polymerase delta subunit